jgi:histidinol-phosphate aminotransferase
MTINLHTNENPYLPGADIKKAAQKGLKNINRYSNPEHLSELKTLLGKYNNIASDRIFISHGSDLLIREIINVFSTNRKIVMVNPSFFPVTQYASEQARRIIKMKLSPPAFELDSTLLLNELNEPALLVLDNPNNPTGKVLIDDKLAEQILKNKEVLLLVDEAYYEFSGFTLASLIEKYPNLAVARTMDKAFSLAGLRVGYLLMGDYFKAYFSDFQVNISTPAIFAATEALKKPEYMKDNRDKIVSEKIRIENELFKKGMQVFPGKANFILIKTNSIDFNKKLFDKNILVYNLSNNWLNGYYRITVGLPEENDMLLTQIEKMSNNT